MPAVYDHKLTVQHSEIDQQGRANNVAFLQWMQDAAIAHSSLQGWPSQRYQRIGSGFVVRSHRIVYSLPAFAGDEITVRTWVSNFCKLTSLRKYRILRQTTDELLAEAETDWVFIGFEKGIPRRIPVELVAAFEIVEDAP